MYTQTKFRLTANIRLWRHQRVDRAKTRYAFTSSGPRPVCGAIILCFCITVASSIASAQGDRFPRLALEESRTIQLPPAFRVGGGAVAESGAVLYWNDAGRGVVVDRGSSIEILCGEFLSPPVAAAFVSGDSAIEIVYGVERAIFRATSYQSCDRVQNARSLSEILNAARWPGGWVLGGIDSTGLPTVTALDSLGGVQWLMHADTSRTDPANPRFGHMSPWSGGIILASIAWPFRWRVVPGEPLNHPSAPYSDTIRGLGLEVDEFTEWAGLPVVELDSGYIQTLADMRSDQRILVLFDHAGTPVRHRVLDVPLGIVASNPTAHLLLVLRRTDRLELVVYLWSWQP